MSEIEQQIQLFLKRATLSDNKELPLTISDFFTGDISDKHIILKRSILYFYNKNLIVKTFPCQQPDIDNNIYTFDGVKVSRIAPQYYIGSKALASGTAMGTSSSNNNNNNNNNNNGNNNG